MDENRSVSSRAVPILIPTFVINSCRNTLFCSFKHLHIKYQSKEKVHCSCIRGNRCQSHITDIFFAGIFKFDKCRHLLLNILSFANDIQQTSVFDSAPKSQPEMAPPYLRKICRIPSSQFIKGDHIFNLVSPKTDISNCQIAT